MAIKEIISGMKLVKTFCWEDPLIDGVQRLRRNETKFLRRAAVLRCVNFSLSATLGRLMIFAIFTGGWWLDLRSPPSSVILAIALLEVYQARCRSAIYALEEFLQLRRSFHRVQEFLILPEQRSDRVQNIVPSTETLLRQGDVIIKNIYARWLRSDEIPGKNECHGEEIGHDNPMHQYSTPLNNAEPVFSMYQVQNVSLKIKVGELIAVTGETGSGKSSLLLAITGELPISKGDIQICGDVSYVQQHSWIFHGTIRENILMMEQLDEQRYQQVIYACGLTRDIEMMPHKDFTMVGERGLMLSGGQKARITLARAIYKEVPIYLLDDPLSAVDSDVGEHIFQHCICGFLNGKTRILVTHQLQYLKAAKKIVIMRKGATIGAGTFEELIRQENSCFANYMRGHVGQSNFADVGEQEKAFHGEPEEVGGFEEEFNEQGSTSIHVYMDYLKAGYGLVLCPLFLLLGFAATIFLVLSDLYLLKWTRERTTSTGPTMHANHTTTGSLIGNSSENDCRLNCEISQNQSAINNQNQVYYTTFSACSWIGFPVSFVTMAFFVSFASRNLHRHIFPIVISAKLRFFDSQPIGRILNRFSRDFGFVDTVLQYNIWTCSTKVVMMAVFMGTMCYTNSWLILALLPFIVCLYLVSRVALRMTRQLKRLEAAARSPIFSFLTDTIAALPSIRPMKLCNGYIDKFHKLQNAHSSGLFMVYATDRSYTLCCLVVFWAYFSAVIFAFIFMKKGVSTDMIALSMIYLLDGAYNFQILTRYLCSTEIQMTSVERLLLYTKLTPEAPKTSADPPPCSWPSSGGIVLRNVNMKYNEDAPLVLRNINLSIQGKEKVGIVGRTGAGKSSLVTLLFRLAESTGEIWIDSFDVTKIGLHELRKKISVIPQDPVLFAGSLRYNLDMFNERSDTEIWDVLTEVRMKETVDKLSNKLYTELPEGGNNFSVGERQLLCLARTILRHNKILILDEATANVDYRTDSIIQETVRRKFAECTVLTVAHRLQTVMESDRILVIDGGEVREFDKPHILLQKEDGYFKRLVELNGMSSRPLSE